ncbi:MAG: L,D-transpeptidase family protein [Proteobacteria bacterium]|nr:L,D-transpeptidase family protein [Pseudomonadota bacterium]
MRQRSFLIAFVLAAGAGHACAQQYYVAQPYPQGYQPQQYYAVPAYQAAPPPRAMARPATPPMVVVAQPQRMRNEMGGGFIEAIFGNGGDREQGYAPLPPQQQPYMAPPEAAYGNPGPAQQIYASTGPIVGDPLPPQNYPINPIYEKQEVAYQTSEPPGTIVIDTPNKFLYLVESNGRALRYGVGVGRPGFMWAGTHHVSAKKEWPDWTPPEEMLQRQPYLPRHMDGGPNNPLGARALYLGSTLYRIHGSNEPWTIGKNVSSGCIRMRNADVIDLYGRVKVGAKVVVM